VERGFRRTGTAKKFSTNYLTNCEAKVAKQMRLKLRGIFGLKYQPTIAEQLQSFISRIPSSISAFLFYLDESLKVFA